MRYILVSDGSSDKALIPIINFLLSTIMIDHNIFGERADLSRFRKPPKKLEDRILMAIYLYEPDMVFIHRDAEKSDINKREQEINKAINIVKKKLIHTDFYIKVIPIRMTEAWLLIDSQAIKSASGNPNSKIHISVPRINDLEFLPDPKSILESLLASASGLSGRRLRSLNIRHCIHLVPQYIDDFSPLEGLRGFKHLKQQIESLA